MKQIILIASLLLSFLWFRDGYIMGVAEGVLPFYDIQKYLDQTKYAWGDHPGLGNATGITVASKPTYILLAFFQHLGIPNYVIEGFVFFLVLATSGLGVYYLTKELYPKIPDKFILFAVFFYWFNPISMVSVWNRFLFNFFFFYAMMPMVLYLFIKGLNSKKNIWALLVSLTTIVFSYALSNLAFSILLWIILAIVCFFYMLVFKRNLAFIIKYFLLTLVLFIVFNFWWITQLLSITFSESYNTSIQPFFAEELNVGTLKELSKSMGNMTDLMRLNNASFFRSNNLPWVNILNSEIVVLGNYFLVGLVLILIIKKRFDKTTLFLSLLFFTGLFLSKGTSSPLGEIYLFLFQKLNFLQVFRNPLEKFGFLLPLIFAPLLVYAIFNLSRVSKKLFLYIPLLTILVWSIPFLTGDVFTIPHPPFDKAEMGYKVKVPDYYKQADTWFEQQGDNFRIIGLPTTDQGITYNWEKGYIGAEIPSTLFTNPVVIFNTTVPFYTDIVPKLEDSIINHDLNAVSNLLNARYILVRKDVNFIERKISNPESLQRILEQKEKGGQIKKVQEFDKLIIWENLRWKDAKIFLSNEESFIKPLNLKDFTATSSAVLIEDKVFQEDFSKLDKSLGTPIFEYKKINPAKYEVSISESKAPFLLVFSELYNPNWQASINGQKIPEHFRTNIYANSWFVEKQGSFKILLEFWPQKWLEFGEKISIISILIGVNFLIFWRFKMRGAK